MNKTILLTTIFFLGSTELYASEKSYSVRHFNSASSNSEASNQAKLIIQGEYTEDDVSSIDQLDRDVGSSGSLVRTLGKINKQYHDEVESMLANRANRSYAKISSVGQKDYVYSGKRDYSSSYSNNYTGSGATHSTSARRNDYDHIISQMSAKYGVHGGLIKAVIHTESSFNPQARSPVGARGLMQLMPATADRFNVSNSYDPHQNIEGGVKYLKWLMARYNGNLSFVLSAYNAGEGNVDKYGGIPPFRETQGYVKKVLERFNSLYKNI